MRSRELATISAGDVLVVCRDQRWGSPSRLSRSQSFWRCVQYDRNARRELFRPPLDQASGDVMHQMAPPTYRLPLHSTAAPTAWIRTRRRSAPKGGTPASRERPSSRGADTLDNRGEAEGKSAATAPRVTVHRQGHSFQRQPADGPTTADKAPRRRREGRTKRYEAAQRVRRTKRYEAAQRVRGGRSATRRRSERGGRSATRRRRERGGRALRGGAWRADERYEAAQ